jgi:hypothetical protein
MTRPGDTRAAGTRTKHTMAKRQEGSRGASA